MFRERPPQLHSESWARQQSLSAWIKLLKETSHDSDRKYFEFEVDVKKYPIAIPDLRELLSLPFEVSLSENNGKLHIITGTVNSIELPTEEHRAQISRAQFAAHTHPSNDRDNVEHTFPSLSDLEAAEPAPKTVQILIHPRGITIYQSPKVHSITGKPFTAKLHPDTLDLLFEEFKEKYTSQLFHDLSLPNQVKIHTDFLHACGSIVSEATWHEHDKIAQILKILNLQA